jgi:hypothetical protein
MYRRNDWPPWKIPVPVVASREPEGMGKLIVRLRPCYVWMIWHLYAGRERDEASDGVILM